MKNLLAESLTKDCDDKGCTVDDCEIIFKNENSSETKYNDYEATEFNCQLLTCCLGMLISNDVIENKPDANDNIKITDRNGKTKRTMHVQILDERKQTLWDWYDRNIDDCYEKFGTQLSDYTW
jgi:hypothetical protein